MNKLNRFLLVSLITAFAALGAAAQCTDAEKMELEKMDKAWGDAIEKRQKEALDGMLSAQYAAFNLSGKTDKKAAMAVMDTPAPPANDDVESISDHYIISCSKNTAVMTHRNEFRVKMDGVENVFPSRSVHVFERNGGKWEVVASVNHPMDDSGELVYMTYSGLNAYLKKDYDWFEARIHDRAVSINAAGKIRDKKEILEEMKNSKSTFDVIKIENINANVVGDMATVIVLYHVKGKSGEGKPVDAKYRVSRNLQKENGKWLMISEQSTAVPDAQ